MSSQRKTAQEQGTNTRHITDFFKAFTVPKSRVPVQQDVEDEIIVASPRRSPSRLSGDAGAPISRVRTAVNKTSRSPSARSTPTKKTSKSLPSRPSPRLMEGKSDDDTFVFSSTPSSQRRIMVAVQIPSPRLAPPPTPTPAKPAPPPPQPVNTSFSSFSTLSSIPQSSQSSSRRIMKGGLQAVTNSDSGSAEDSSDELADVDTFIPRKKVRITPPGDDADLTTELLSTAKPTRQSARLSDQTSRNDLEMSSRLPTPPRMVYKHSLLKMGKQVEKDRMMEQKVAAYEYELREAERRRKAAADMEDAIGDTTLMAAAAADDSDQGERMRLAIERTEAGLREEVFHYFPDPRPREANVKFPVNVLSTEPWAQVLRDDQARDQACLTGFVSQLAKMGRLTQSMIKWFAFQTVYEPREDLCEAYIEIVRRSAECHPKTLDGCLSHLSTFYIPDNRVGDGESAESSPTSSLSSLESNALNDAHGQGATHSAARKHGPVIPQGLGHVVQIVQFCAPLADAENMSKAITELALANVDSNVVENVTLRFQIQDAIEVIADHIPIDQLTLAQECIASTITNQLQLSRLVQAQLVAALPAFSAAAHDLRRMLALHCVTRGEFTNEDLTDVSGRTPIDAGKWADRILKQLKSSPEFAISDSTDYALLSVLANVLDIAIDRGFHSDFSFIQQEAANPAGPFAKPSPHLEAERTFNADIDALTNRLNFMISRIKGSGAAHLRRTEANNALESVVVRLENTVRTRPRPRRSVFGGGMVEDHQKNLMQGFVKMMGSVDRGGHNGVVAEVV